MEVISLPSMPSPQELARCGAIPLSALECKEAFERLDAKERLYAHFLSKASWAGAPIVLEQTSLESPAIFDLFLTLFRGVDVEDLR